MTSVVGNKVADLCVEHLHAEVVRYMLYKDGERRAGEEEYVRLEHMGFQVGLRLAERYTRSCPRFTEELQAIKFVCKEFWLETFRKQIDNLRTNRRGIYVLHDARFQWLTHTSAPKPTNAGENGSALLRDYVMFPCGLIRGVLASLGITAAVQADISTVPTCTFTIKIKESILSSK